MHASRTFSPQRQSKVASRRSPQPVRNQAETPLYEILESLEARVDLMEQMRQTRNLIQERARAPARGDDGVAFGEDACGVFLNGIDARDLCLQVPNLRGERRGEDPVLHAQVETVGKQLLHGLEQQVNSKEKLPVRDEKWTVVQEQSQCIERLNHEVQGMWDTIRSLSESRSIHVPPATVPPSSPRTPVQGYQKPWNEEDAAIRAKLEDALKSTEMLNIEKQLLELQLEDERRRQEWLSQREQRERDELYTELREMLSGQQDERAEGPLTTVPLDTLPVPTMPMATIPIATVPAIDTLHFSTSPANSIRSQEKY